MRRAWQLDPEKAAGRFAVSPSAAIKLMQRVRATVSASCYIAQIELARENYTAALPQIVEAYDIVTRIGRLAAICVIGKTLGQLLAAAGQRDAGLAVLRRSADGYCQLGRPANAGQVDALIFGIGQGRAADP